MCAASHGAVRGRLHAPGPCADARSSSRRRPNSAATADFLDTRHHDLRSGAQRGQIEIRVVLLQQPQWQLRAMLAQCPHRIAWPCDADLRTDYAMCCEVRRLQLAVVLVTQRLEYLGRNA